MTAYPDPLDTEAAIVREQRRAEWWADASEQTAEHADAMREETLDRDDWEEAFVPDWSEL